MAHSFIYLGKERGKRVIYKVGLTTQTCYARCKNDNYQIGIGIEIDLANQSLRSIEKEILEVFAENHRIEHGNEYFHMKKHNWEMAKDFFLEEMRLILRKRGLNYTIHEGWVTPNSY